MLRNNYSPKQTKYFISQYQKGMRLVVSTELCLTESSLVIRYSEALECFSNIPQNVRTLHIKAKIKMLEKILENLE